MLALHHVLSRLLYLFIRFCSGTLLKRILIFRGAGIAFSKIRALGLVSDFFRGRLI